MRWIVIALFMVVLCGCIPGDANQDGRVNILDFSILSDAYGSQLGDSRYNWCADFNGDGFVDAQDFAILQAHYGEGL
jgi:hypothetical protein